MVITREQQRSAFNAILAVTETVREAGPLGVPSGTVYAVLMAKGCTLEAYERLIRIITSTGLVRENHAHLLTWTGPEVSA